MRIKDGPSIHQGDFVATLEQHRVWRYVITRSGSGEVLYDGWTGELTEAAETADRHLSVLCQSESALPKAS